ncbi:hypothetical protein LBMAG42_42400 [Deltaproteobacteria bacterium]|nr:hypothetical protein LBMAG42_42400 [Deltaproteobacteria bacterium]
MRLLPFAFLSLLLLGCEVGGTKVVDTGPGEGDPIVRDDEDTDGYLPSEGDCDDSDDRVNPGATEICDGIDNDCDGGIDEGVTLTFYADLDEDGFGDPGTAFDACEPPDGYIADNTDCDDSAPTVHPGATEACNLVDDDCDGAIDEDFGGVWYADADGDGFGDSAVVSDACGDPGAGWVLDNTDCDDSEAISFPGGTEVCDGHDNNCDGAVDEGVDTIYWADTDTDGYGDALSALNACSLPTGYAENSDDCDDAEASVNPGATEVCNGGDDDCDTLVDDADPDLDLASGGAWYSDSDGDGYGDLTATITGCTQPIGTTTDNTDCDDTDITVNPGALELCNGIDDDCDALIDDADPDVDLATGGAWYTDADGDGYGDPAALVTTCEQPADAVSDATDCDDADAAVNPAATELCNGFDDNCDGTIDEDTAADASIWYADADGDGYGDAGSTTLACDAPTGYLADDTDCDDTDFTVYPGAPPRCGLDADCDGAIEDIDPGTIYAGSLVAGDSQRYQYSDVSAGLGWLDANWIGSADADTYEVAVGTSAGAEDVLAWTDRGGVTADTLTGLSVDGAWTGAEYFVSVRATTGGDVCATIQTSEAVQIAEAALWTGDVSDLRATDAWGGYTVDWPEAGTDSVYGEHWFEEVNISSTTVVRVQGWGAVDGVSEGVAATDSSVTDPSDGWLAIYANEVTISGTIVATGAGYGGGGGGGGGSATVSYRGRGGSAGLGGDGGVSFAAYAGAGGGGSPGGIGGAGATVGGDGNLFGGGSGSTGCSGSDGRDGGDGTASTYGGTGGTASSGVPGTAGVGEFAAGGGTGVSGCDNWSGGGGGGYGAGGGGGAQWAGGSEDASGGGGGGTGGEGGGDTSTGGAGAGPYGGAGGVTSGRYGVVGTMGGYLAAAGNGDASTDRSLTLGSGGGGGGGGYQEAGGGGGAAGGGAIHLYAAETLWIESSGRLLANGAGGGGGAQDNGGSATSAAGGGGGGGGLRLEGRDVTIDATCPAVSARGGAADTSNGGTIKLFYDSFTGTTPAASCAGRVYDAGAGSFAAP